MAGKKKGDLQHDNSRNELTDDETHALTLQWKGKYERALADKKKFDAAFKDTCKKARAELGDTAILDIKDLIAAQDEGFDAKFQADLERKARIARWAGIQVGEQADLFDFGAVKPGVAERAYEDGKRAGMAGEVCSPPFDGGSEGHQKFVEGWHAGQAVLAGQIKKTEAKEVPLIVNEERPTTGVDEFDAASTGGEDGADDTPWPDDVAVAERTAEDEEHAAADDAAREQAETL